MTAYPEAKAVCEREFDRPDLQDVCIEGVESTEGNYSAFEYDWQSNPEVDMPENEEEALETFMDSFGPWHSQTMEMSDRRQEWSQLGDPEYENHSQAYWRGVEAQAVEEIERSTNLSDERLTQRH